VELGKISWSVLRSDGTLAWFPVLSFIGADRDRHLRRPRGRDRPDTTGNQRASRGSGTSSSASGTSLAFVSTYFLAAPVHGANERLDGREVTLGGAIAANAKLHRLLPWALVQGTVSIIIAIIEQRFGVVGRSSPDSSVPRAIVTFLTIPIIA
jgi:hypothetical protein